MVIDAVDDANSMLDRPAVQAFVGMAQKRSFPPKHTIIHSGEEPTSLFLVLDGSVAISIEDENGREIVLAYLGPGDYFGEMCLFPDQQLRTAIVRTRRPTLVAEVDYQAFRDFAQENLDVVFDLAGQLAARLRDTTRRLGDLAFLDVAGRMAHVLLELVSEQDAVPHARGTIVRTSRMELARLVGCSREMAGRVLKTLEEDGMVQTQGRNILVLGATRDTAGTNA